MRKRIITAFMLLAAMYGVANAQSVNETKPDKKVKTTQQSEEPVYRVVEHVPTYPGGFEAMYEFLKKEMRHPEGVEINPGNSRVIIRFVVEKDGRLTHFEVLRSPDEKLSEEALRLVKMMPRWTPAKNKGEVVRCLFTIPVTFVLKDLPQDSPPDGN